MKSIQSTELLLIAIFIVYLVFPIHTPRFISPYVESPLGVALIFGVSFFLFVYSHPILAILFIFVGYELLRRSGTSISANVARLVQTPSTGQTAYIQTTPNESERDAEIQALNPPQQKTLEEQVVDKMAPIGKSEPLAFVSTGFKPVSDNLKGASFI